MRVLLIEDDEILGEGLAEGLRQEDCAVDWLTDGGLARGALDNDAFDVVVLDLGLPAVSGWALLKQWRQAGHTVPVIVITAYDALEDRIAGLDGGADDYVVKPVALEELLARLRALVRRTHGRPDNRIAWGEFELDRASGELTRAGEPLSLSRHERALLEALLERAGHTLSREQLQARLYGWEGGPESNSLEVHIHNLRRKLGRDSIRTVRGLGYRMAAAER